MGETGRLAVFHGTGKPFEIREYPVPEPEPGAMLIRIALANICGSDMHYWRGEQNYEKMGRPLPLNTGHEHVGTVARLGSGVTTDSAKERRTMSQKPARDDDDLRPEYDFSAGVRGRHFEAYKKGTNVVFLDPDVAAVFKDSAAVNTALRLLLTLAREQALDK